MKRFLLMFAILPMLLLGCAKDDNKAGQETNSREIELETYAHSEFTWNSSLSIGVFMNDYGLVSGNNEVIGGNFNRKYNYVAGAFKPATTAERLIFPYSTTPTYVDYVAYHPYSATLTPTLLLPMNVASVKTTLTIEDLNKTDLLYSNNAVMKNAYSGKIQLVFKHKMSKVHILVSSTEVGFDPSKVSNVHITKFSGSASFNLKSQNFVDYTAAGTKFPTRGIVKNKEYETIVLPQPGTGYKGKSIVVTYDGAEESFMIPDALDFESGKVYKFNIDFKDNSVSFVEPVVIPWTNDIREIDEIITPDFTNSTFKSYVQTVVMGGGAATEIYKIAVNKYKKIDLLSAGLYAPNISELTGIQHFTALDAIKIEGAASLKSAYFSKNTKLRSVELLGANVLTRLDVTDCYLLQKLHVESNSIKEVDISNNKGSLRSLALIGSKFEGVIDLYDCFLTDLTIFSSPSKSNVQNVVLPRNKAVIKNLTLGGVAGINGAQDFNGYTDLRTLTLENLAVTMVDLSDNRFLTSLKFNTLKGSSNGELVVKVRGSVPVGSTAEGTTWLYEGQTVTLRYEVVLP